MKTAILSAKIARAENILRAIKREGEEDKGFYQYNQGKLEGLKFALKQTREGAQI